MKPTWLLLLYHTLCNWLQPHSSTNQVVPYNDSTASKRAAIHTLPAPQHALANVASHQNKLPPVFALPTLLLVQAHS